MITLVVVLNLVHSRTGRAIMAIRDNRIAAESVGINVTKYKLMAFVTSAALAGAAGALFGLNYSTVAATQVRLQHLHSDAGVRGAGRSGQHLGLHHRRRRPALCCPRPCGSSADYRMLVYAIVLILVMLATNNPTSRCFFAGLPPEQFAARDGKGGHAMS